MEIRLLCRAGGLTMLPTYVSHSQSFTAQSNHLSLSAGANSNAGALERTGHSGSVSVHLRAERVEYSQSTTALYQPQSAAAVEGPSQGAVNSATTILSFIEAQLLRDIADGATQEELASRIEAGLQGFQQGFEEASQQLQDMGLLTDDIRTDIGDTYDLVLVGVGELRRDYLAAEPESEPVVEEVEPTSAESVAAGAPAAVAYGRYEEAASNRFSFELTTADGDRVRINATSLRASLFEGAVADGRNLDMLLQYQQAQAESNRFFFSVEGELDEDELAAINELLQQVNDIAEQFFAGDLEQAFNSAMELGYDASEIAQFSLNLQQTSVQRATTAYRGPEESGEVSLSEQLRPLGGFAQSVLEALDTASVFDNPGELVAQLAELFERRQDSGLLTFIESLNQSSLVDDE